MKRYPLEGEESNPHSFSNFVLDNGFGPIKTLDSAPIASNALDILPKHMDSGHVAGVLYLNLEGHVYSFTGTLII